MSYVCPEWALLLRRSAKPGYLLKVVSTSGLALGPLNQGLRFDPQLGNEVMT